MTNARVASQLGRQGDGTIGRATCFGRVSVEKTEDFEIEIYAEKLLVLFEVPWLNWSVWLVWGSPMITIVIQSVPGLNFLYNPNLIRPSYLRSIERLLEDDFLGWIQWCVYNIRDWLLMLSCPNILLMDRNCKGVDFLAWGADNGKLLQAHIVWLRRS